MLRLLTLLSKVALLGVLGVVLGRLVAERRFHARLARPYGPWPEVPSDPPAGV